MGKFVIAAVILVPAGIALATLAWKRAPGSGDAPVWDLTLVGGICLSALGVLSGVFDAIAG